MSHAFGVQILAGESGAQTDKTEVDLATGERRELVRAGQVE